MSDQIIKESIIKEFEFLKSVNNTSELVNVSIKLKNGGFLMPINYACIKDDDLIKKLFEWREKNSFAYPSRNKTSVESTKLWLEKSVLKNKNKILFRIINENLKFVGHIGLFLDAEEKSILEIDNVLRGEDSLNKGIMGDSVLSLIEWSKSTLFPKEITLRVLKSNRNAIKFYEKLNFLKLDEYPLYKYYTENGYNLMSEKSKIDDEIEDFFIKMIFNEKKIGDEMILTAGPSIGTKEKFYSADATINGWNNEWNKYLKKFENSFAEYIGVKYAIATSSCTGAMQLALMALDIGEGDEVIVPDITWVSTANVVHAVGATPIFADVNIDSWTIDPESIESKITPKTKAIIPVHMYGHPADMDPILEISKKYKLKIIEDAAPSVGAYYLDKKTGSFGDFSAFSFQGAKLLVTGEGGMLCTNNENLFKKAYRLWDQGRIPGTFWIEEHGPKYKMSNIQAAIGLGQLERNDLMVYKKRQINSWYKERLTGHDKIIFWEESNKVNSICWMTSIRLKSNINISREEFCKKLKEKNIDTRPVFPSISQYPYWKKKQVSQINSSLIAETGINLPSGVCLTKSQIDYICNSILEILKSDK